MKEEGIVKKIKETLADIDVEDGLAFSEGNVDNYKKLLRVIYTSELKSQDKLSVFFEAEPDLELLRVTAHGIKSSLASIGAKKLSKRAYDLEIAARDEKISEFLEEKVSFANDYLDFLNKLKTIAAEPEEDLDMGVSDITKEETDEYINKIIASLENYDIDDAEEIFEKLRGSNIDATTRKLVNECEDLLLSYAFDDVIKLLQER